jgi:hypothetical protein
MEVTGGSVGEVSIGFMFLVVSGLVGIALFCWCCFVCCK